MDRESKTGFASESSIYELKRMPKRPDISVILLFNRQVVRADFSNKHLDSTKSLLDASLNPQAPTTNFFLREQVDVESTLGDSVSQVIAGHPPLAARTIVLSSDVWTQVVALPRLSVSGIEPDELQEALKFEAETLSGIDIDEVSLAWSALGTKDDHQQYWVSAIRQSDLDHVNKILEQVGCREISIAHPAGLARFGANSNSIEIWDDLAFQLSQKGSNLVSVKQASLENANSFDNLPVLNGGTLAQPQSANESDWVSWIALDEDENLTRYAADVAANYVQRMREFTAPLIRLTKGTRSTPIRHLVSAAIAIAVIGFCFWHWQYIRQSNVELVQQIELTKQPAIEKKKFDSQLMSILSQREEVESEDVALSDDLKRIRFFLSNQNDRIAKLLNLLVELRTQELVVQKIGGNEEGVLISGITLNGESAQALAKRLREKAVPLGWVVNPARQQGQQKLTTGGPWDYEIQLTDTGPFESAIQSRKKTNTTLKSKP
jgi:hypothetical protein